MAKPKPDAKVVAQQAVSLKKWLANILGLGGVAAAISLAAGKGAAEEIGKRLVDLDPALVHAV
jgi:hypothetical protein